MSLIKTDLSWQELKDQKEAWGVGLHYFNSPSRYYIHAIAGPFIFFTNIKKEATAPPGSDQEDFETNFKSGANKPLASNAYVVEESLENKTGGHFAVRDLEASIPSGTPGDWTEHDFSWPFPVSLLAAEWPAVAENDGDEAEVQVAPNTVVGALTANVAAGVKTLPVDATTIANMKVGYAVSITDGTNTDELGYCTKVDKTAGTIDVETATANAFSAASPTYVRLSVKMVPWKRLKGSGFLNEVGHSKIGGSYLAAGKILRIRYRNNSGTEKKFVVGVEYLY